MLLTVINLFGLSNVRLFQNQICISSCLEAVRLIKTVKTLPADVTENASTSYSRTAPLNCLRCLCNPQYSKRRTISEIYVKLKQLVVFLVRAKNKKLRQEKNTVRS